MSTESKIVVRNQSENGCLVGLPFVLRLLPPTSVTHWILRNVTVCCMTSMFGNATDIEAQSRLPAGFQIDNAKILKISDEHITIIDGLIEGADSDGAVVVRLDCIDSSQWEITVRDNAVANIIRDRLSRINIP